MNHIYENMLNKDKTINNHQLYHFVYLHKHHYLGVYYKWHNENFQNKCSNHKTRDFYLKGRTTNHLYYNLWGTSTLGISHDP